MKLFKKAKKGFTLVELVVVIAVIAILSAVSVGAYFGITESANKSAAEQEAKSFHTALILVANAPENADVVTLSKTGLDIKDTADEADVIDLVEASAGVDYTGRVDFNEEGTQFEYTSEAEYKVYVDVVTGAIETKDGTY